MDKIEISFSLREKGGIDSVCPIPLGRSQSSPQSEARTQPSIMPTITAAHELNAQRRRETEHIDILIFP